MAFSNDVRRRVGRRLAAVRGAIGFLTRLPVGHDAAAWDAFRRTPAAVPLVGYLVGGLIALPFLVPALDPTVALVFVAVVYLVTGVNHADGVADLGDAAVVHGTPEDRRAVMTDTTTGVGGVLALVVVIAGLVLAGLALADLPLARALGIVVASEVGAKLGMALLACSGDAAHEGLGSQFTDGRSLRGAIGPVAVGLPALALTWPTPAAAAALGGAVVVAGALLCWTRTTLGGVSGDAFGATNELGRVVALHAGVIAWTLS